MRFSDKVLTCAPTVLLVGIWTAALFDFFIGQPWFGFFLGAGAISALAVWAFWGL